MNSPEPKVNVKWAAMARRSLVLHNPELLNQAIAEAKGQPEIVSFLEAFTFLLAIPDGDTSEVDRLTDRLIPQLNHANRHEEVRTVNLFYLDTRVSLLNCYTKFPLERQQEAKELGIKACQLAIRIAKNLNDKACEAFYSVRLADCFRYSHHPREAEYFYAQALPLYRKLVTEEPNIFNPKLTLTLSCLGVIQIELQKLKDAEKSLVEAVRLYRDLAAKEPKLFKEKAEIAENNLTVVQILQRESMDEEIEHK